MKCSAAPLCSVCCETLGKYGGPVTLPCGHNGCLQCMAHVQKEKPECPLCRASFDRNAHLVVNRELRDLISLLSTLHTVEEDGWQTVATSKLPPGKGGPSGSEDGSEEEGDSRETSVTLLPTAPPMHITLSTVLEGGGDLLSLEPPSWMPDSQAQACGICEAPFRPFRRARHHCRLCGAIFCHTCCHRSLLLPPKFQLKAPQRVCEACVSLLQPLQPFLAGTISKAVQPAVHDVTDGTVMRSWFNNPLSSSLEADIYKATNMVRAFAQLGQLQPDRSIPASVLQGMEGIALLSVVKAGMGWSYAAGTGLVMARREGGGWSAPCAVALSAVGWGMQAGGELNDLLLVLRNKSALQSFCGAVNVGMGGNVGMALGPLGRQAEAGMRLGMGGAALCYSYSLSRGMFAGVAVEGTVVAVRNAANLDFYGQPRSARELLLGDVPQPAAAAHLYTALDSFLTRFGATSMLLMPGRGQALPGRLRAPQPPPRLPAPSPPTHLTASMTSAAGPGSGSGGNGFGGIGFGGFVPMERPASLAGHPYIAGARPLAAAAAGIMTHRPAASSPHVQRGRSMAAAAVYESESEGDGSDSEEGDGGGFGGLFGDD